MTKWWGVTMIGVIACLVRPAIASEVVVDGTLGSTASLSGSDLEVGADLGERRGDNLFHSFSRFQIDAGESVTFTGPNRIDHVIARITGDEGASIQGRLASRVGNADFWLVSPQGIAFGPDAIIDLPGAFHAAAGASVQFSDGSSFSALDPEGSILSVAEPQSFGLLGAPGDLRLSGTKLDTATVGPNGTVELASGNALIIERDSLVRLAGNGGGRIVLNGGTIQLRDTAQLINDNEGDARALGAIELSGDTIDIAGSVRIVANTSGNGNAGDVAMTADQISIDGPVVVRSTTLGPGDAGSIRIRGGEFVMTGGGRVDRPFMSAQSRGEGSAGSVDVKVDGLFRIGGGGRLTTAARATGDAGPILIEAGTIEVNGQRSFISSTGAELDDALGGAGGDISLLADNITFNDSTLATNSEKRSGDITLTLRGGTGTLSVLADDGKITSDTFESGGQAGNITIDGGQGTILMNEVARITSSPRGGAEGGDINIEIGRLELDERAFISTTTFGSGTAGEVRINAQDIQITGTGLFSRSGGIFSSSRSSGDASGVFVDVENDLLMLDGARMTSNTTGLEDNSTDLGRAGVIVIDADRIVMTDDARISSSGNPLRGRTGGEAGTITIRTNELDITNGQIRTNSEVVSGSISISPLNGRAMNVRITDPIDSRPRDREAKISSATTEIGGDAGDVTIDAGLGTITMFGRGNFSAINRGTGEGGEVTVIADRLELNEFSFISTTTEGRRDAGTVMIDVGELVINGTDGNRPRSPIISSSTRGESGAGDAGTVVINAARSINLLDGARVTSNSTGDGNSGTIIVDTDQLVMRGNSVFASAGNPADLGGSGAGGNIQIAANDIDLEQSTIRTEGENSVGGAITIAASRDLTLTESIITTDGLRSADNTALISIDAGRFLTLNESAVLSRIRSLDGDIVPADLANAGIASLSGGLLTISTDSNIQATFAVNISGQDTDAGSGLTLPESVLADVGRLLNNRCSANRREQGSSFQQSELRQLEAGPDGALSAVSIPIETVEAQAC